MGGPVPDPMKI